jgi:HEAT repeat protein
MGIVSETLKFEMPPKEKVLLLVKQIKVRSEFLAEIEDYFQGATDADKAICLAAMNQITKGAPTFVQNKVDFIISQLGSRSVQVKLEAGEIIAGAAGAFPDQVAKAIPALTEMAKDQETIVRWGAAYALTEIAKSSDQKTRKELIRFFKAEAKKEKMSSVRNLYLDALTALGKGKPQNTANPETA